MIQLKLVKFRFFWRKNHAKRPKISREIVKRKCEVMKHRCAKQVRSGCKSEKFCAVGGDRTRASRTKVRRANHSAMGLPFLMEEKKKKSSLSKHINYRVKVYRPVKPLPPATVIERSGSSLFIARSRPLKKGFPQIP